jgi:2-polyprenyl-3-methyl-5-hydroxy-6-metoxy-1,4-benzoquinol methylase
MKIKLFSDAHLRAAQELFPEHIDDPIWLNTQWTDQEINACKALEYDKFMKTPTLQNYPYMKLIEPDSNENKEHTAGYVDLHLCSNPNIKSILSIGCGFGNCELWLAARFPEIEIIAIDNAPYVEKVNNIATERGLTNILFRNIDLREASLKKFDMVFSHAVIYCIPDKFLLSYFETLVRHTRPGGSIFVGSAATISPLMKLRLLLLQKKQRNNTKQTGWIRDWHHIQQFLPNTVEVIGKRFAAHDGQVPLGNKLPLLRKVISKVSKNIYPLSYSTLFIHLKKISQ